MKKMPIGDSYTLSLTAPPPHLTRLPRLTRVLVVLHRRTISLCGDVLPRHIQVGVTNNSSSTIHTLARLIRVLKLLPSSSNDALTSNSP
jgi:hypothetical protein